MSRRGTEQKPPWSAVPRAVKDDVAGLLGSPVARASRVYGGYAPSATFRMVLEDGRHAFFKGVNAQSNEYMRGALSREERVYRRLPQIAPWAPGPRAERIMGWYADVMPLRDGHLDASVSGIAAYFADRAWRPPIPGVPRVHAFQRRQLKVSLAWASRRLALPEPTWLAAVAD